MKTAYFWVELDGDDCVHKVVDCVRISLTCEFISKLKLKAVLETKRLLHEWNVIYMGTQGNHFRLQNLQLDINHIDHILRVVYNEVYED